MTTLLEDFFKSCEMHSFTYDTLVDAKTAATWMLKGANTLKAICIVAEEDDMPEPAEMSLADFKSEEFLCIRSREVVPGNWFLVTSKERRAEGEK